MRCFVFIFVFVSVFVCSFFIIELNVAIHDVTSACYFARELSQHGKYFQNKFMSYIYQPVSVHRYIIKIRHLKYYIHRYKNSDKNSDISIRLPSTSTSTFPVLKKVCLALQHCLHCDLFYFISHGRKQYGKKALKRLKSICFFASTV